MRVAPILRILAIKSIALSETAYALASSSDGDNPPYQVGLAYSLRTQGYLKPVYPL
jgi:hypothetical protein